MVDLLVNLIPTRENHSIKKLYIEEKDAKNIKIWTIVCKFGFFAI